MKIAKVILAGAIAAASVSAARADVTVYITGATAYRSAAVSAIKAFLNTDYVGVFGTKSGVTDETNAANIAFSGHSSSVSGQKITIKACWAGSVGGIKLIQTGSTFNIDQQPGAAGWIPDANLPAGGSPNHTINGVAETTITFEKGATAAKPDAAFSDAFQRSALGGAAGTALPVINNPHDGIIGVIPFDWVVCSGVTAGKVSVISNVTYASGVNVLNYTGTPSGAALANGRSIGGAGIPRGTTIMSFTPTTITISNNTTSAQQGAPTTAATITATDNITAAPFNNISSNQAQQVMSAGAQLPLFTGQASDAGIFVFPYGRNADSGTRISVLGESGLGLLALPGAHLQPAFDNGAFVDGKGGSPAHQVTNLQAWPGETVLGVGYVDGASGYNGGGDLANALTAYGTPDTVGIWTVGYLGRGDSKTATAQTFGVNTAKRLTFNGQQDWNGAGNLILPDGTPAGGFNDAAIQQGNYQGWEYEHFYKKASVTTDVNTVLTALANSVVANPAVGNAIQFSTVAASKAQEGAAIGY